VAINQDPDADIFKVANLGIVAPWEALLPALLDELR
jgi:electron transfer flavoprotein alpha subunit